jgi:hypothetical protein
MTMRDVMTWVGLLMTLIGGWFLGAGFGYSLAIQSAAGCAP